jgi:dTDP-4-dehydrorhamnose reductase
MKIAVIGANGQLGSDICRVYREKSYNVIELNHDILDITNKEQCQKILSDIRADILINTAAMHNVEACEDNPLKAFEINGVGVRNLAILSQQLGFVLVHISTDYVFDGRKKAPYNEDDCPMPLNVYGNTKLAGEIFVRIMAEKFFILRVSGLFGRFPCRAKKGMNFVKLMLKLAKERGHVRVVDDEILSPTYTLDIAEQLEKLTRTENWGLYHVVSDGECSWYEFAQEIFQLSGVHVKLEVADPGEFPSKAPRPKYSALENLALKKIGLNRMPHWRESLKRYLEDIEVLS